jgi:hypothetical protein
LLYRKGAATECRPYIMILGRNSINSVECAPVFETATTGKQSIKNIGNPDYE